MNRTRIVTLLGMGLLIGLACYLALCQREPPEPQYAGQKLSEWLAEYCEAGFEGPIGNPRQRKAEQAVHQIGTNAIPALLRWIGFEETRRWGWLERARRFLSTGQIRGEPGHRFTKRETLHGYALTAFAILGREAEGAVPELSRMIGHPKGFHPMYDVKLDVMRALFHTGEAGLPAIMAALRNSDTGIAAYAAEIVACYGSNALPAVPVLIGYLNHKDEKLASVSISSLARLRLEPTIVVPALTKSLGDPRPNVRLYALSGVGAFGSEARSAMTNVAQMRHDPTPAVSSLAHKILQKIAPDTPTDATPTTNTLSEGAD